MTSVSEKLQRKTPSSRRGAAKQVRLKLVHVDFWSSLKIAAIVGVVSGIILIVVVFLMWSLLNVVGLFDSLDNVLQDVLGGDFSVMAFASLPQAMLFAAVLAVLNLVVITVLGAIFAVLYNLSVRFTGGLLVGFTNQ
ncbi:DUF3566 domain-containing protein [Humidisolicoccus flavus]|uniref:DUF3566 domain-containing protein n=1 Tax=Humidisolicoccus flavus TaxID=3111414 RepID=UPI003251CE8D